MNKGYFEGLMKLPPETLQQKYVFLVSSLDLSLNIISAGGGIRWRNFWTIFQASSSAARR